jgi:ribokinase
MSGLLLVLGSANRDYTVKVERHPARGETVLGGNAVVTSGGKGANQAVAAARAGVTTHFLGAVGRDSAGDDILADLESHGVLVSHVLRSDVATGIALITVSHDGENSIVVAPGANGSVEPDWAAESVRELATSDSVVLAQLEIPVRAVDAAATAIVELGGRFVLNRSPATTVSPRLLGLADPLIVNETEASELAGSIIDSPVDAQAVARRLLGASRSVVITLGGEGAVVADAEGVTHLPAPRVPVVDTTGAGDAFAGALAAALVSGSSLIDATSAGIAAGAEAVQHAGAQPPR